MMNTLKTTAAAIAVTVFAGVASANPSLDVYENAEVSPNFKTLVAAADAADLSDLLSLGKNRYTIFAPTDEAFRALPAGTVERLLLPENKDELRALVAAHIVPALVDFDNPDLLEDIGAPDGSDATPLSVEGAIVQVDTLDDANLLIDATGGTMLVSTDTGREENAIVVGDAIEASNGVIHAIDRVLTPAG